MKQIIFLITFLFSSSVFSGCIPHITFYSDYNKGFMEYKIDSIKLLKDEFGEFMGLISDSYIAGKVYPSDWGPYPEEGIIGREIIIEKNSICIRRMEFCSDIYFTEKGCNIKKIVESLKRKENIEF